MTRPDWIGFAIWGVLGAFVGAFWAGFICLALWPFAAGILDVAGKLNGCEALSPQDCVIFAQEGW